MPTDPDKLIVPDLQSLFAATPDTRRRSAPAEGSQGEADRRLYLPLPEGWSVHIQRDGVREYCHEKAPGEEHFHLIVMGEIYLQRGDTKLCINCALRLGVLTLDRRFWIKSESSMRVAGQTSQEPPEDGTSP